MNSLIFAGEKKFGYWCLKSLQRSFDKIYILDNSDELILSLKRNTDELILDFDDAPCTYVFLGGYSKFITADQLNRKTYINIHGALLPRFRGMHSIFWAIMNFDEEIGLTVHLVDEYMDSGDVIHTFRFPYYEQPMTQVFQDFYKTVDEKLGTVIMDYLSGKIIPVPQKKEEAVWGCKRNLLDCYVDFNWSNRIIDRFFKALTPPYPLPRILFRGKDYEIIRSKTIEKDYFVTVGRCLNVDNEGAWIKTNDGFLIIQELMDVESGETILAKDIIPIGYRFINKAV